MTTPLLERPTISELALSADRRRRAFHRSIAAAAAALMVCAAPARAENGAGQAAKALRELTPSTVDPVDTQENWVKMQRQMWASHDLTDIRKIQEAVADHYGLSRRDLLSDRQTYDVARPRQLAMYLARELTQLPLAAIGRRFKRDHSTVHTAVHKTAARVAADAIFAATVNTLKVSLS